MVDDQRTSFSGCSDRQRVLKINWLTSGDVETNPGPGKESQSTMSYCPSKTRSIARQTKLPALDGNLAMSMIKND